jgi:alkaline phosphatase D
VRRLCVAVAVAAAAVPAILAASAGGATSAFPYGVAAGEIRSNSAVLWTRAPKSGAVSVELVAPAAPKVVATTTAARRDDLTVRVTAQPLRPGTAYRYRFRQGAAVSPWGSFRTAPSATAASSVRFAVSGDADATPGPNGKPAYNRFETYAQMARERNDFNINLGDTIYSDSEVGGAPVARTIPAKWEKYRLGLELPALRLLRGSAGLYSHWDDHEFINDFSRDEHGDTIYLAGLKAFTDYAPVVYAPTTGLYRSFRWGKHLELFFLDERSFRSAKADSDCANDLAPTAPQAVREAFVQLAPPLANPVAETCLAELASPARTMLGASQRALFLKAVRASQATFKVIVNEVPMMQLYALPYDRWEGYAAERTRVLERLQDVSNVVFLTTDTHAHLIGEIRLSTLEGPAPVGTGIWEAVTGPVATNTYAKEIDRVLGMPGAGALLGGLFLKPQPPQGLGLACAAIDQYGYAEVSVTATRLTVTPKTPSGRRVLDVSGRQCPQLVVRAS